MMMTAYHATTMGCNKMKYSFHLLINGLKKKTKRKKDDSDKNQIKYNKKREVNHNKSAKPSSGMKQTAEVSEYKH